MQWLVYILYRQLSQTERVDVSPDHLPATEISGSPVMSGDGRYVAFDSYANNLVLNDTDHSKDIFVRGLATKQTELVSLASAGQQTNNRSLGPAFNFDLPLASCYRFAAFRLFFV